MQNTIIAGGYYAIGLNAQKGGGSHEEVLDRAQKLAAIQDTIKFNDPATLDDRLGELLHLSAMVYHQNLSMTIRKIAPLLKVTDTRDVSEIMYSLTVKVNDLFGAPRAITPVGIMGDMDRDVHTVIPIDGNMARTKPYMLLESTQSSFLEHNVTEKIYQTEAISSVKGIQLAADQGIPVHTITSNNINTELPLLQLSADIITDISNAVNTGQEVIVPERNITLGNWTGIGYIIQDPQTGKGAYLISGGYGGAAMVYAAYVHDMLVTHEPDYYATQSMNGTVRRILCFPGSDNEFNNQGDTCYIEIGLGDIQEDCGTDDPGCRQKYSYQAGHDGFVRPLIDTQEHTPLNQTYLTKNIKASDWQSQDSARYMRVGYAALATIEALMKYFDATTHNLNPTGAGYRTKNRNTSVGGSETSHHMDGTAADFRLETSGQTRVQKCQILRQAHSFIGGKGEVLAERKDGEPKTTVHIAIPGLLNIDGQDTEQWGAGGCP